MKGIDISHYQGKLDFKVLRDNIEFVIAKATDGVDYIDPLFGYNRDNARKVGLPVGFYHYAEPQVNSPLAEADWFTKVVSCQPGEILALDFEEHYPDPVNWCKLFLDRVTSNMGFKPVLYINYALVKSFDWKPVVDAGYGLWLAYWTYNADSPVPSDVEWNVTAMRQYSNKGDIAGNYPIDLDVFYGNVDAFKKYGNPPPTTTTTTTTTQSTTTTLTTLTTTPLTTTVPPDLQGQEGLIDLIRRILIFLGVIRP